MAFAQRLALELNVPVAYFYALDDDLARLILWFGQLNPKQRKSLVEFAGELATAR
ncbi:hypothetical protein [Variovorax sp. PDNC026]|uniref:hypothetical protein n=1 Tax=Variovorax sp. PDNC026 TaxID=2811425 RepID=UPI0031F5AB67